MADTKISALTAATTPLAGTEVLPIVQSGATKQVSVANLTAGRDVSVKNLAISATLQTWYPYSVVNQFGLGGILEARSNYAPLSAWATNTYIDASGNDRYIASGEATRFEQNAGLFRWKTAPSGTAGALCTLTNRMELANATGDLSLKTGNLIQGTAAKGINFTANTPAAGMTSQLLNWYEEGTWTPLISADGLGTQPFTTVSAVGRYTRIGRQVTIVCQYAYSSIGAGGGSFAVLTGLPFARATGTEPTVFCAINQSAFDTRTFQAIFASTTGIYFQYNNGEGTLYSGAPYMTGNNMPAAGTVRFVMSYFV